MAYTFLFSLCIETLQLVTKVGVFDVDDLLMNTAGGLAGWVCYCVVLKVYRHCSRLHANGNGRIVGAGEDKQQKGKKA